MEKTCGNCGNPCGRENCGFWEPNNEVLEQRYQQLAEVAKFLYQLSSDLFKSCGRNNSFHLQLAKTQLEELGVEL